MKQFTLDLNENVQRPVARLTNWHQFDVMLDTGALFPVWVDEEKALEKLGAKCVKQNVTFGGFGGEAVGNLYRLPYFQLGELIFPELPIISCKVKAPCHMILSASMFSKLSYEIDDEHHKLNVTIPDTQSTVRNLTIWDDNGHLQVLCTSGDESQLSELRQ